MKFLAFSYFNAGNGPGMFSAAEIFLEIKNIAQCTGHIQFLRIDEFFHRKDINVQVKLENYS